LAISIQENVRRMMSSEYKYDIFISYNKNYWEWVYYFAKRLKRRKFKVFLDKWEIKSGESIPAAIRRGLKQSRYIIPVMTPEWTRSEWCQLEADIAVMLDPSASRRRIIPILLRDCEIPEDLARLKYADFRNQKLFEENFNLLVKELRNRSTDEVIKSLTEKQREKILNFPILPWTPEGSPSFGFLWPELFIEPHIKPHKLPVQQSIAFYNWIGNYDWKSNIAIVGSPGIGKSTILRAIFLRLTDPDPSRDFYVKGLVIIAHASEVLEFAQGHNKSLIDYLASKLGIQLSHPHTFKDIGKLILVLDGLDEISEVNVPSILNTLNKLVFTTPNIVLWVACRKEFFFRKIAIKPEWNALFSEILEILEWDENRDSLVFVSRYAEKTHQPFLYDKLLVLIRVHPEIVPFLRNPFELTLLLYLLSYGEFTYQYLRNSYTLYKAFYENWLVREHHRGTASLPPEKVSQLHRFLASTLYSSKGMSVDLGEIVQKIDPSISLDILTKDTSFICLLKIKEETISEPGVKVERFWHETIGEFLVAEELINAFKVGGQILYNALITIYNYEVNLFVRGAFQTMSRLEREKIFHNFEALYISLFSSDCDIRKLIFDAIRQRVKERIIVPEKVNQSEQETMVREQILYYIGRLPLHFFPEILRFAYYNEPTSLLRRIAALGAMLHGEEEIERDYISKLTPGSREDIENRSVQLVYFGDVEGDIHAYQDDNKSHWARSRSAIYQRLKLNSQREMRLRWWDLRTLYLFYESRKWTDAISDEDLDILINCSITFDEFSDAKKESLAYEKERLIEKLRKIKTLNL